MDVSALTNPEPEVSTPRASLKSILNEDPAPAPQIATPGMTPNPVSAAQTSPNSEFGGTPQTPNSFMGDDDGDGKKSSSKRSHHRTYHTLLTGSKVRHLKKKDGEPLWRADIQYDFLRYVFENEERVFTNPYSKQYGSTFADIYIDTMARSSKTSKVLREKLLSDRKASTNMAMVCLLVNIGRMNTTLNFFPEMKAQLRTYHPIPSLQCYSDTEDQYKQLQDAPRLKSILKGACEDRAEPITFQELRTAATRPKTNPVNLIFLMSTYYSKVQQRFFTDSHDVFDLVMNRNLSSESRGRAFLWLVWAYLETDQDPEQLKHNPFGPGLEDGTKMPALVQLTEEEIAKENVDPPIEVEFGTKMTRERTMYIESTNAANMSAAAAVMAQANGRNGGVSPSEGTDRGLSPTMSSSPGPAPPALESRSLRARDSLPDYRDSPLDDDPSGTPKGKQGSAQKVNYALLPRRRRPGAMEIRARKCQLEIERILSVRERRLRRARYAEGSIKRLWDRMKDKDALYDSEEEWKDSYSQVQQLAEETSEEKTASEPTEKSEEKSEGKTEGSSSSGPAIKEEGSESTEPDATAQPASASASTSDTSSVNMADIIGEEMGAIAKSLRRAVRWTRRWRQLHEQGELAHQPPSTVGAGPPVDPQKMDPSELKRHSLSVMRLSSVLDSEGDVAMGQGY